MFEARYFSAGSYTMLAKSATLSIGTSGFSLTPASPTVAAGGKLKVNFTAGSGKTTSDWIGLFPAGGPSDQPVGCNYSNGTATGSVQFDMPTTPGTYELRYVMGGSATYSYVTLAQAVVTVQ